MTDFSNLPKIGGASIRTRKHYHQRYAKNMDRDFLQAMGVRVVQNQPWQFSLYFADLKEGSKFVWYPGRTGTLMFEGENGIYKVGTFKDAEKVFDMIMHKVNTQ